jgi:pantoate--beta-alanine ligase
VSSTRSWRGAHDTTPCNSLGEERSQLKTSPAFGVRVARGVGASNVYLGPDDRQRALVLSRALRAGQAAAAAGRTAVLDAARAVYAAEPIITADYLELRTGDLGPAPTVGAARLLTAAQGGSTRLLDNVAIELGGSA